MVICIIYFSTAMKSMYIPPLHAPSQTERLRSSRSAQLAFSLQQVASLNLAFYHYLRLAWQQPFIFIYFFCQSPPRWPPRCTDEVVPFKWTRETDFSNGAKRSLVDPTSTLFEACWGPASSLLCLPVSCRDLPNSTNSICERRAGSRPIWPEQPSTGLM